PSCHRDEADTFGPGSRSQGASDVVTAEAWQADIHQDDLRLKLPGDLECLFSAKRDSDVVTERVALSGEEALEVAGEFQPQIVLMDVSLPGLSGYDIARTLRSRPWAEGISLVAMTGW